MVYPYFTLSLCGNLKTIKVMNALKPLDERLAEARLRKFNIDGVYLDDKFLDENGRSWVVVDFREEKSMMRGTVLKSVYAYDGSNAKHFSYETVKEGLTGETNSLR